MVDRLATPDIMANLMPSTAIKQENSKAVELESNKAIKQEVNKAVKKETQKAIKPVSNKAMPIQLLIDGTEEPMPPVEEEVKEKATFNLPVKLLGELEDKCHEIRKLCGSKQISKTLIVEEALRMAFADFDLKKHIGKFYGNLVSNKAIKQ